MLEVGDLRSVVMLNYLSDPMLKKLLEVTSTREYEPGEYIFREGEYADRLFSVWDGRVALEVAKNAGTLIRVTQITRGMTFGISALVDTERRKYLGYAKSLSKTEILNWRGSDLEKLFVEDREMGFLMMSRIANILNRRLEVMNMQLVEHY